MCGLRRVHGSGDCVCGLLSGGLVLLLGVYHLLLLELPLGVLRDQLLLFLLLNVEQRGFLQLLLSNEGLLSENSLLLLLEGGLLLLLLERLLRRHRQRRLVVAGLVQVAGVPARGVARRRQLKREAFRCHLLRSQQ